MGIDNIFGNEGNDTLYGGVDPDAMIGGTGDDVMYGGDGIVTNGILDADPAVGAALLDDNLAGGQGNDTLYGGGGWDDLNGQSGHDMLIPGAGGIVLGGRDVMDGGEGDDIYIVESAAFFENQDFADGGLTPEQLVNKGAGFRVGNGLAIDEVRLTSTAAGDYVIGGTNALGAIQVFTGVERIVIGTGLGLTADRTGRANINVDASLANPGLNVGLEILANAGDNVIVGTSFNDTLDGGAGRDTLEGGLGNDTYIIDAVADVIVEGTGAGSDTVVVQGNFNYTLADDLENLTLQGTGALTGTGNNLDNIILGNAGANVLLGLAGDDIIDGGLGNDTINGGAGVDVLTGGTGTDRFVFDSIADIGNDPTYRERIADFATGDILDLNAIDANINLAERQQFNFIGSAVFSAAGQLRYEAGILYGNVDNDLNADFQIEFTGAPTLSTASFVAAISGTNAANTLNGTAFADYIFGLAGNDGLNGLAGNDVLDGGAGNDTLNGGDGDDTLIGGGGVDSLVGGLGNDLLIGTAGQDVMTGGAGSDIFKFSSVVSEIGTAVASRDTIVDFASGLDIIDLSAIDANTILAGDQAFTFIGTAAFTGAGQLRYASGQLQGNVDNNLTADFIFTIQNNLPTMLATDFVL